MKYLTFIACLFFAQVAQACDDFTTIAGNYSGVAFSWFPPFPGQPPLHSSWFDFVTLDTTGQFSLTGFYNIGGSQAGVMPPGGVIAGQVTIGSSMPCILAGTITNPATGGTWSITVKVDEARGIMLFATPFDLNTVGVHILTKD